MTMNPRTMRLTPELVARIAPFAGGSPKLPSTPPSDADYDELIRETLAAAPSTDDVWLFAYGSLIWKPACEFAERRVGLARGWHRSFCLGWDKWFRGSEQQSGIMMSLDRGGQCMGVAYRLPPDAVEANLGRLLRREMRVKPHSHLPRWVSVYTEKGPLRGITFAINRSGPRYLSGLSVEEVADALAVAVGPMGSMADYLYSTVSHLEALGIRDRHLWRLQELVAERIEANTRPSQAPLRSSFV